MNRVVFGINVTLDGCCDHTAGIPDEEVHLYFARLTREASVLLYGRKTYELMVPYWPEVAKNPAGEDQATIEFAKAFASVPQIVVVSKTLANAQTENTTIVRDHLEDEIKKLKLGSAGSILTGGVTLPSELLELGLIDEIHLVVHPVVAGKGRRLFNEVELAEKYNFKLLKSHIFKSGCVALHYLKST